MFAGIQVVQGLLCKYRSMLIHIQDEIDYLRIALRESDEAKSKALEKPTEVAPETEVRS